MAGTVQNPSIIKSYLDNATQKRSVVGALDYVSATEFPFLQWVSGSGAAGTPKLKNLDTADATVRATKLEWQESELRPIRFVLNGTLTNVVTTVDVTPTSLRPHMVVGLVLDIEGEQMLVTVAGTIAAAPTVLRGWAGTTAVAHVTNGVDVSVVSRAHEQGKDAPIDPFVVPTLPFNYWQVFKEEYDVSFEEMQIDRFQTDPQGYLARRQFETTTQAFATLERAVFWGKLVAEASGTPPNLGGFPTLIDPTFALNKGAAALATADINTAVRAIYDNTGKQADTIWVSGYGRQALSSLYSLSPILVYRDQGDTQAGAPVDSIRTDMGTLKVMSSPFMPTKSVFIMTKDYVRMGPLGELEMSDYVLASSGDYERHMILGVYTLQVRMSKCHYNIFNIA